MMRCFVRLTLVLLWCAPAFAAAQQAQLPADRALAGIGPNGVLILAKYDRAGKFYTLERTRVLRTLQP